MRGGAGNIRKVETSEEVVRGLEAVKESWQTLLSPLLPLLYAVEEEEREPLGAIIHRQPKAGLDGGLAGLSFSPALLWP